MRDGTGKCRVSKGVERPQSRCGRWAKMAGSPKGVLPAVKRPGERTAHDLSKVPTKNYNFLANGPASETDKSPKSMYFMVRLAPCVGDQRYHVRQNDY